MDLYGSSIGSVLRDLRLQKNMTQKELAKNICTQGQLSKIEKGEVIPSSVILYELTQRLGVNINYIFRGALYMRADYADQTCRLIRQMIRQRDYEEVARVIRIEKKNDLFETPTLKQFLIWHEGIIAYYLEGDYLGALKRLEEALAVTPNVYNERRYEIMNSIAILHFEEQGYEKAKQILEQCLTEINRLPEIEDRTILIRIFYNLAKCEFRLCDYKQSVSRVKQAIRICENLETTYLLGDLYSLHAIALLESGGNIEKVKEIYEKAFFIFSLQGNEPYMDTIRNKLQELFGETESNMKI